MARYFFNISELLDAGQSIDDVKIEVYYDENKASYDGPAEVRGPIKYDDAGTYYVEVDWSGRIIYGKREIQLALISSLDSNYKATGIRKMTTAGRIGKEFVRTEKIPLYLNGVKYLEMSLLKLNRRRRLRTDRAQHRRRLKSLHWRFCTNTEIQRQLQKISEAPLKLKIQEQNR